MNKLLMMLVDGLLIFMVSCNNGNQANPVSVVIDKNQISYGSRLTPQILTEKQIQELEAYIGKEMPPSEKVWFVQVYYNKEDYLTAGIYLKPDSLEGRIRKGHYFGYNSLFSKYELTEYAKKQMNYKEKELPEYMQVLLKDASFKAELEIPPQDSLFPFDVQDGFSDQEIVKIIDFIRSGPTMKKKDVVKEIIKYLNPKDFKQNSLYNMSSLKWPNMPVGEIEWTQEEVVLDPDEACSYYPETPSNSPIVSIEREGELIEVNTGSQEGPVSGGGESVRIKKTDSGYELVSIGIWYS